MRHPGYPIFALLGLLAVLLPSPWHWRTRNVGTLGLIFWLSLTNFTIFLNSLLWADNVVDRSPGWCDLTGRIFISASVAVPACSFTQMRRLEAVASTRRIALSHAERVRRIGLEIFVCFGLPCLQLVLRYVTQGHRYDIFEHIGCQIPSYVSWPHIVIQYIFPLVLAAGAAIYAALAFRWFVLRRLQFKAVLHASKTGLTTGRYLRLIALAVTDVTLVFIGTLFVLISTIHLESIQPYSWRAVHSDFSPISQYTEDLLGSSYSTYAVSIYLYPLYSFSFFIFFGFGEEAINEYVAKWTQLRGIMSKLCGNSGSSSDPSEWQMPTLGTQAEVIHHLLQMDPVKSGDATEPKLPRRGNLPIPVSIEISVV